MLVICMAYQDELHREINILNTHRTNVQHGTARQSIIAAAADLSFVHPEACMG